MRNILLFVGIAVLAFQDYFKKQPVKQTRRQQFLQTGETSQVFIEGTKYSYSSIKKQLKKYFGKPKFEMTRSDVLWSKELPKGVLGIYLFNNNPPLEVEVFYVDSETLKRTKKSVIFNVNNSNPYQIITVNFFKYCYNGSDDEEYRKLYEMANSGDWELALEIAKSKGLL